MSVLVVAPGVWRRGEASDPGTSHFTWRVAGCLLLASAAVAMWIGIAAATNGSQLHDSLEQFIWGRSLQWGYWKHPPLASWLMWGALRLAGPTPLASYGLAALLAIVTLACTARLAWLLAGPHAAVVATLLLALHNDLTRRGQMYNHNTVLLATVAATACMVLIAVRRNRPRDWMVAGVLAGLALLAKYQAVIPLAGLLVAIWLAGDARRCAAGLLLGAGVCALVVAPHLAWAASGAQTLAYAADSLAMRAPPHGRWIGVSAMQLKFYAPALLLILVSHWIRPRAAQPLPLAAAATGDRVWSRERIAWAVGLLAVPLLVLLALLAGHVNVQSHWGLQCTQFLPVVLAIGITRAGRHAWDRRHLIAWGALQAALLAIFAAESAGLVPATISPPDVRAIDARSAAAHALAQWDAATACPARYVSGPAALAGMVAAYAGRELTVLEDNDLRKSPWVDAHDMAEKGWIELSPAPVHDRAGSMAITIHPPHHACERL